MLLLPPSLDASNLVTNGENMLFASLKLPQRPDLTIGESAGGIVSVNGNALAASVYSVICDINESGSVEEEEERHAEQRRVAEFAWE